MLITGLFIFILFCQLSRTISFSRQILVIVVLLVYLLVTLGDYYWLCAIHGEAFHPSDPYDYYYDIIDLRFSEVLRIESSNTFYFIINWFYWKIWGDPYIASFLLKINNVLVYLCAYLLLTKKKTYVSSIDYLLLFNPYTIMTMVRNVRDMYIILFVVMILLGLGVVKGNKLNLFWMSLAILLLLITRSVLLLPLLIVFFELKKKYYSVYLRYGLYAIMCILFLLFSSTLIRIVGNQMISAMAFIGEETDVFLPLLNGELSVPMLKSITVRLCIGLVSFIFTPHPVNFISNWLTTMDQNGLSGIYTGTDNLLIALGSVFNYLFVLPLVILFILNYKKCNRCIFLFVTCYIILYVVSYLGVSDIRNRNTAIFFILASIMFSDYNLKMKRKYYLITFGIFCCIMLFTSS